jgi:hypothetical protein
MENILNSVKKLLFQHVLTKHDMREIAKVYMKCKGVEINEEEGSLTIRVCRRSEEQPEKDS